MNFSRNSSQVQTLYVLYLCGRAFSGPDPHSSCGPGLFILCGLAARAFQGSGPRIRQADAIPAQITACRSILPGRMDWTVSSAPSADKGVIACGIETMSIRIPEDLFHSHTGQKENRKDRKEYE